MRTRETQDQIDARFKRQRNQAIKSNCLLAVVAFVVFIGMVLSVRYAIIKHFENQDAMLCRSAIESGNHQYYDLHCK